MFTNASKLSKDSADRFTRSAHFRVFGGCLAAAMAMAMVPGEASAQFAFPEVRTALRSADSTREIRAFYEARDYQPLWIRGSTLGPEADSFLELIQTADLDGLDRDDYRPKSVASAIRKARGGSPKALAKAEMVLTRSFADYVRDVREGRDVGMVYVDRELAPETPSVGAVLRDAAARPDFAHYVASAGWAHPIYNRLRYALSSPGLDERQERLLRLNMDRARILPGQGKGRYILVDTASARLWMYEDGQVRDTMKVIVGKPSEQTPMMAAMIRFATVNPYWNIPPDLVDTQVAATVLTDGMSYLKKKGYEVLSDWSDDAKRVDPSKIDWKAVASGAHTIRVRQLPGRENGMGKVKFTFPNDLGIYLHDTPNKQLFRDAERRFSAGCVRLEDAQKLGKWLFGKPLKAKSTKPEQALSLPEPVPVYITYLTAAPEGQNIAFRHDAYNRDQVQMARAGDRRGSGR